MGLNIYITSRQAERLTGVPVDMITAWADSERIRSTIKRLYSTGHLVLRTADVIEAAVVDGYCSLAEIIEPIIDDRCAECGQRRGR